MRGVVGNFDQFFGRENTACWRQDLMTRQPLMQNLTDFSFQFLLHQRWAAYHCHRSLLDRAALHQLGIVDHT